uniref:Ycf2 n=1 Tax=Romanomermis culicivorax TaxID=13658 RepID=A0A915JFL0_ROMCU
MRKNCEFLDRRPFIVEDTLFCLLRNEKTGFRRSSSFYDERRSFLRA